MQNTNTNTTSTTAAPTNNAQATVAAKAQAKAAQQANATNALQAYTAHCASVQKANAQVHAGTAYAVQQLMLANKPVTADQQAVYNAFVALVQQAQQACVAVKGKATTCGVFNYLDGRVTGHKVATGLQNSTSLTAFLQGLQTLAANTTKATTKAVAASTTKAAKATA